LFEVLLSQEFAGMQFNDDRDDTTLIGIVTRDKNPAQELCDIVFHK
jgi:hypothetical protein